MPEKTNKNEPIVQIFLAIAYGILFIGICYNLKTFKPLPSSYKSDDQKDIVEWKNYESRRFSISIILGVVSLVVLGLIIPTLVEFW